MSVTSENFPKVKQEILNAISLYSRYNLLNFNVPAAIESLSNYCKQLSELESLGSAEKQEIAFLASQIEYLKKHSFLEMPVQNIQTGEIIKDVNINIYPSITTLFPGTSITLGDLHGNALKLLFFLVKEGFVTISPTDYEAFVSIYNKVPQDATSIKSFHELLERIQITGAATISTVRLIGDVLGDRGRNDYFTLKFLEKLNQNKVPTEILFSNHDIEFLEHYENNFNTPRFTVDDKQARSTYDLDELIQKRLLDKNSIDKLVEDHYLPNLLVLSYSIDDRSNPPNITIYTHAPVGLKTISALASKFGLATDNIYDDVYSIARTIDAINSKFRDITKQKGLTKTLLDEGYEQPNKPDAQYTSLNSPLVRIAWRRLVVDAGLDKDKKLDKETEMDVRVMSTGKGYTISYVHGHDGMGQVPKNEAEFVKNLDNLIGKDVSYAGGENYIRGVYYVHQSFDKTARTLNLSKNQELKSVMEITTNNKVETKNVKGEENKIIKVSTDMDETSENIIKTSNDITSSINQTTTTDMETQNKQNEAKKRTKPLIEGEPDQKKHKHKK